MTREQLKIFQSAFKKANNGKISLPNKFELDKITELEFYTEGMRGGRKVRFFIKQHPEGKLYLDFFAADDYSSWHKRIEANGDIIDLENYEGQFGRTIYPEDAERTATEHQAIQKHNDKVHLILVSKGLERNFNDPEFEKRRVIRRVKYW